MQRLARTIQIFLPSGNPAEIQVAELTTGVVQLIEVPRKLMHEFLAMRQAQQVGVYFLVGEDAQTGKSAVYIGQSGTVGRRLDEHHQVNKFDWTHALVAVSLKEGFTGTHVLHLEWQCIQQANEAQRYTVLNGNAGSKPHTPLPLEADCIDYFQSIRMLLSTLGQRFLVNLAVHVAAPVVASSVVADTSADELVKEFRCGNKEGVAATGQYTAEGMVVLKGSRARREVAPSFEGMSAHKRRALLIGDGSLRLDGNSYVFSKDVEFGSPSGAADVVLGRASNGWVEWKDARGVTLDALVRQPLNAACVTTD